MANFKKSSDFQSHNDGHIHNEGGDPGKALVGVDDVISEKNDGHGANKQNKQRGPLRDVVSGSLVDRSKGLGSSG